MHNPLIECVCCIIEPFLLSCSEYVCDRLAGAGGHRESSTFTPEVLPEHSRTIPGILLSPTLTKIKRRLTDADAVTCPRRCGASRPMALAQSTSSQEWVDSYRPCCSVTLASGQCIFSPKSIKCQFEESFNKTPTISFFHRVQKECLAFSPLLPSDFSELCIRGVSYLGCRMDWLLRKDEVCVILRQQAGGADSNAKSCNLQVLLKDSGIQIPLMPGNTQTTLSERTHLWYSPTICRFIY